MTIKCEVEVPETTGERKYPYIGKSEMGNIVFFTSEGTGMTLKSIAHDIGYFSKSWAECDFKPLPKGTTITLTQE